MAQDILLAQGLGPLQPEPTDKGWALPWISTKDIPHGLGMAQATADLLETILSPHGIHAEFEQDEKCPDICRVVVIVPAQPAAA